MTEPPSEPIPKDADGAFDFDHIETVWHTGTPGVNKLIRERRGEDHKPESFYAGKKHDTSMQTCGRDCYCTHTSTT